MQGLQRLGSLALVLVWAGISLAQTPSPRTISVPEVEVRSGPSSNFYPTGKLRLGDQVQVIREEQGWLAIQPPRDAFSWISTQQMALFPGTWQGYITVPQAKIRIGSRLINQPPSVEALSIPQGSQVAIIGGPSPIDNVPWYMILPTAREVRYIPADAVRTATSQPMVAQQSAGPPAFANPAFNSTVARSDGGAIPQTNWGTQPASFSQPTQTSTEPLWIEAERTERAGNLVGAIELYERLAGMVKNTNYNLYLVCLNRSQTLRDRVRAQEFAQQQKPQTAPQPQTNGGFDLSGVGGTSNPSVNAKLVSQQVAPPQFPGGSPSVTWTDSRTNPANAFMPATVSNGKGEPQYTDVGELYRAPFSLAGTKTIYGLRDANKGTIMAYAIEEPGVNLDFYVNKMVRLYGVITYNGELRRDLIAVRQVSLK